MVRAEALGYVAIETDAVPQEAMSRLVGDRHKKEH